MKNFLYAVIILGSLCWFLFAESSGDIWGYLSSFSFTRNTAPTAALLGSAAAIGLLLFLEACLGGKGKQEVVTGKGTGRPLPGTDDVTALQDEKRRLENELLQASDREDDAQSRITELEGALKDAQAKLQKAKSATSRPAEIEAELCSFLGILQQKGRFVDFLMEDVSGYSNEQVGAAARVVHQGCSEAIKEYFEISPLHEGAEGEAVSLDSSYDPLRYKLLGDTPQNPPYQGKVLHRGWRTARVTLPRVVKSKQEQAAQDVITPAEVEVRAA
jgi:hypothetical protein